MFERRRRVRPPATVSVWPFLGMGLVACDFFLYGASLLVAPWYGVLFLAVVWLVLLSLGVAWWTPHPRWITPAAVVAALVWFAVLVGGGAWLGWGG